MLQRTFTPRNVINEILANDFDTEPNIQTFRIFDPEGFSAGWNQRTVWRHAEEEIAGYFGWSQSPDGHAIISWEFLYLASTFRAIEMAKSRDLSAIHSRLRVRDLPLSQEERDILADRAEGKLKFKRGPKKKTTPHAYLTVLLWFEIVEGVEKKDSIISEIEEHFGVSYSHVNAMLGKIYGTSDEVEIRDAIERLSVSELWKAEMTRFLKDLFSK